MITPQNKPGRGLFPINRLRSRIEPNATSRRFVMVHQLRSSRKSYTAKGLTVDAFYIDTQAQNGKEGTCVNQNNPKNSFHSKMSTS